METIKQEELRNSIPEGTIAINEIFYSIQGEGRYSGTPMIFIRFNLCSIGCKFCDTKYTWANISHNNFYTPEEILNKIKVLSPKCKIVCITGGEPLEQESGLLVLSALLVANGYKVHLETSGAMVIREALKRNIYWITCSPKNFNGLNFQSKIDEVKILVKKTHTVDRIRNFVNKFRQKIWVSIQPIEPNPYEFGNFDGLDIIEMNSHIDKRLERQMVEGCDWNENCKIAIELCKSTGWHLSLQIHKQLMIR